MRRLRAIDLPPALGAVALLVVLSVGSDSWGDVGWLTAGLSGLAVAFGLLLPAVGTRRSPTVPILWNVLATLVSLAAVIALLADGVPVGALAGAVELAGAYYAMKDDRQPGAVDPPVELRPAPPAA